MLKTTNRYVAVKFKLFSVNTYKIIKTAVNLSLSYNFKSKNVFLMLEQEKKWFFFYIYELWVFHLKNSESTFEIKSFIFLVLQAIMYRNQWMNSAPPPPTQNVPSGFESNAQSFPFYTPSNTIPNLTVNNNFII